MTEERRDNRADHEDAAREAQNVGDRAAEQAQTIGDRAAETVQDAAADQKDRAAEHVDHVAEALRNSAEQLEPTEEQLANLVGSAAGQLEDLARTLREKDLSALVAEVQAFGRRHPAAFMGAAVALGFGISRFAKSSAHSAPHGERPADERKDARTGSTSGQGAREPFGDAPSAVRGVPPARETPTDRLNGGI